MKHKRNPIILSKLATDSVQELGTMGAELNGETEKEIIGSKLSFWSRRFAASGKGVPSPKIRPR